MAKRQERLPDRLERGLVQTPAITLQRSGFRIRPEGPSLSMISFSDSTEGEYRAAHAEVKPRTGLPVNLWVHSLNLDSSFTG